jgi:chromosome segregation ATPase
MPTISTQTDHCVDVIARLSEDFDQENDELRKTLEHHWRCREIADAKVIELNEVFKHADGAADIAGCEISELGQRVEEHLSMIDDKDERIDDLEDDLNLTESAAASLSLEIDELKARHSAVVKAFKKKIGEILHRESLLKMCKEEMEEMKAEMKAEMALECLKLKAQHALECLKLAG